MSSSEPVPGRRPLSPADAEQAERLHRFAHDLKNRLTGLHEVLQHVRDAKDAAELAEFTGFAERNFIQALHQIEGLLDDLGVARGVGKARIGPVDLDTALAHAIEHARPRAERKGQRLPDPPYSGLGVLADLHFIEQILDALLSNASKFSPSGSPIDLQVERSGAHALITVTDHGVGLTAEDLPNVFVRYAWLSSRSTAEEAQGRGTLARMKQFAEAMSGTLEASSGGAGKGCTFSLQVPLAS